MGRLHYALLVVLVLYFPLRVKPGPVKDGDVSSDVTTEKADPFKAADMINLYRSSKVLAKRKQQREKAKKKLANTARRPDSTTCSSESENSDYSDDNFETSEHSDDVSDNRSDWDESPFDPSDGADDPARSSGAEPDRCCNGYPYDGPNYSNDSDY